MLRDGKERLVRGRCARLLSRKCCGRFTILNATKTVFKPPLVLSSSEFQARIFPSGWLRGPRNTYRCFPCSCSGEQHSLFSFFPLLFTGLAVLPAAVPKEVIHCSQDTQCFPAHYGISTVKRERKRSTIHACNISKCETVWLYVLRHFEPNSVCEGV